jgi:nucleotide-binding universal stress UspA family protein
MAYKDILVHLDGSARGAMRLRLARELAAKSQAHLTGLYAMNVPVPTLYMADTTSAFDFHLVDDVMNQMRRQGFQAARGVEQGFLDEVSRNGVEGEWRLVEDDAAEAVVRHARYADLTFVGQADPDHTVPRGTPRIAEATILASGRPVIVVPYAGDFEHIGRKILVGWKNGREAARAVSDAMPLLEGADSVIVLSINPAHGVSGEGDLPAVDITHHLARHGVSATATHTVSRDVPEGDVLLNYASDIGADMIVCGAYGHSRSREFVFGGVTRTLLAEMTVPVLFSH